MNFDPFCWVIVGAPGTGKTSQIRIQLAQRSAPRRLVVDPVHTLGRDAGEVVKLANLPARLAQPGPFSLVVQPPRLSFEHMRACFGFICKQIIAVQSSKAAAPLLLIVDELADVTHATPGLVPESWAMVMRDQRHYKLHIIACSQRPAEIDKRIWSFATRLRAGRLNSTGDVRALADVLMVPALEVSALIDRQWIERDKISGTLTRGALEWRRGRPVDIIGPGVSKKNIPRSRRTHGDLSMDR